MGNKRARNRIPALPEAVKNLLAIHSLEAWPAKGREFNRGARVWSWRVIKAGDDSTTGRTAFTMNGSCSLDQWIASVKEYIEHKTIGFDFEGTLSARWNGADFTSVYFDEFTRNAEAIRKLTKFP